MAATSDRRHGDTPFIISRRFTAPRARVWRAWTEVDELKRWFGPAGMTLPTCTLDLRPGGMFHYCMRTPDGQDWWGRWIIRAFTAPASLSTIVSFSDAAGGITAHPLSADWPRETLGELTLAEHSDETELTVRWTVWNGTPAEHAVFDRSHAEMRQGWSGTLDQLAAYLNGA